MDKLEGVEDKDEPSKDQEAPKSHSQIHDYDIQNPTLKVVDKASPTKTSIKGKGCTAENCDATRAPCCKVVAAPPAKKDEKKSLAQVHDYDIQNPTLKVVDKSSPVKTSIKGKGCTAENCDATRAPCCKVVAEPPAKKDDKKSLA